MLQCTDIGYYKSTVLQFTYHYWTATGAKYAAWCISWLRPSSTVRGYCPDTTNVIVSYPHATLSIGQHIRVCKGHLSNPAGGVVVTQAQLHSCSNLIQVQDHTWCDDCLLWSCTAIKCGLSKDHAQLQSTFIAILHDPGARCAHLRRTTSVWSWIQP